MSKPLPDSIARAIAEDDYFADLIRDGDPAAMHCCGTAQRKLREIWMDMFRPGWRAEMHEYECPF